VGNHTNRANGKVAMYVIPRDFKKQNQTSWTTDQRINKTTLPPAMTILLNNVYAGNRAS
jgi:hypothetical protein